MKELILITSLVFANQTKDTIFCKEEGLAKEFEYIWKEYPIDSVKSPVIIVIK